jgi:hypothetical protein
VARRSSTGPWRAATIVFAGLGLAQAGGCVRVGPSGPTVRITPAEAVQPASQAPVADLATALASLDTLFVPADPDGGDAALLEAVRRLRLGDLSAAVEPLAMSLRTGGAPEAAGAILGQLLLHEHRWAELRALTGGTGTAAALADAFASGPAEAVEFLADEVRVPLHRARTGTPVIDVEIGGVTRRFWVDTGAGLTVLSAGLADELGLEVGPEGGLAAGTATARRVPARSVVIPELGVPGAVRVRNHPAIVLRDEDLRLRVAGVRLFRIDGILGWPFIRHLDLTLDHGTGVAVIRRPLREDRGPRNLLWLGYPLVVGHGPDGQELLFGLDTGAAATSLAPAFLEATGVTANRTRSRRVGGAGGFERQTVEVLDVAEVMVAGRLIRFGGVDVRPTTVAPVVRLHGILGSDLGDAAAIRLDWLNGRFDLF